LRQGVWPTGEGGDARERAGDPAGGDGRFVLQRLQGVRRHPIVHPDDLAVGWQNGTGPGVDRGETGGETGRQRFCQAVSHADLAGENSGKPGCSKIGHWLMQSPPQAPARHRTFIGRLNAASNCRWASIKATCSWIWRQRCFWPSLAERARKSASVRPCENRSKRFMAPSPVPVLL